MIDKKDTNTIGMEGLGQLKDPATMEDVQNVAPSDKDIIYAGDDEQSAFTGEDTQTAGLTNLIKKMLPSKGGDAVPGEPETPPLTEGEQIQDAAGKVGQAGDTAYVRDYGDVDALREEAQFSGILNMEADDIVKFQSEALTDLAGTYVHPSMANPQRLDDLYQEFSNDKAAIDEMAKATGFEPGDIVSSKTYFVASHMLADVNKKLSEFIAKVYDEDTKMVRGLTDEEVAEWQAMTSTHRALDLTVRGSMKEAARILQMGRMSINNDVLNSMIFERNVQYLGDREGIMASIKAMADTGSDMKARSDLVKTGYAANWGAAASEMYRAKLLWNPKTLLRNTIGSVWMNKIHLPSEKLAMGAYNQMRQWLGIVDYTANPMEARTYMKEVYIQQQGQLRAFKQGMLEMMQTMKATWQDNPENLPPLIRAPGSTKIDGYHEPSFTAAKLFGTEDDTLFAHVVDTMGRVNRAPFAIMGGQDAYFKRVTYNGQIDALAYRVAQNEARATGLKGADLDTVVATRQAELIAKPTPEMIKEAWEYAERTTFTQPNRPGAARNIGGAISSIPGGWAILPFKKTPINMINETLDYTPGVNAWGIVQDFRAGGIKRQTAAARFAVSSGIGYLGWELWNNKEVVTKTDPQTGKEYRETRHVPLITGAGPSDRTAWMNLYSTGWRPFSVYKNGKYVPYNFIEPEGAVLGLVTTVAEMFGGSGYHDKQVNEREMSAVLSYIGLVVGEYYLDKSMLSGVSDILSSMSSGEDWAAQLGSDVAKRFLPPVPVFGTTGMESAAKMYDEVQRYSDLPGFGDRLWADLQKITPILSRNAAPTRDRWGELKLNTMPISGNHIFDPFTASAGTRDPKDVLVMELNINVPRIKPIQDFVLPLAGRDTKMRVDLRDVDGTGHYFQNEYAQKVAKAKAKALDKHINSGAAARMSHDPIIHQAEVRRILATARSEAHREFTRDNADTLLSVAEMNALSSKPLPPQHLITGEGEDANPSQ